ncbi:hypothetical protein PENSPDRAFT_111792 [Peniophora sp. CONT]|nr:hypothetical protein PENSPDRAFT_111792 [Peniophora sp. CONT]
MVRPLEDLPVPSEPLVRAASVVLPLTENTPSFTLDAQNKSFKHQYANIYFLRLRLLRTYVEKQAEKKWHDLAGSPRLVPRVLEVTKGQLCFIVGTVYMDMPLKPNVLEDIGRDRSIPAPPPPKKIFSDDDVISLEDESGRIRLVGERVKNAILVTGVIAGVLGVETAAGDFEVVDVCFADLPPHDGQDGDEPDAMQIDDAVEDQDEEYIAVISGLDIGPSAASDAQMQMVVEYLTGEGGGPDDAGVASRITRLIVAGNSLAPIEPTEDGPKERKAKRYGHDPANFSPHPIHDLSGLLADVARSMPVHILAGQTDPQGVILPQQPFPRAMFGDAAKFASFSCETNPTYLRFAPGSEDDAQPTNGASSSHAYPYTRTILATSGQPLSDLCKYVPTSGTARLDLAEATLRWRHMAPTAPDTLWCHPFFTTDPFVLRATPDVYVHGCQPHFATRLVEDDSKRCRVVLAPSFAESGVLVLIGLRTLNVRTVKFAVSGMAVGE